MQRGLTALAVSVGLHVAAGVMLLVSLRPTSLGGETQLDAISVTLVEASDATASVATDARPTPAASATTAPSSATAAVEQPHTVTATDTSDRPRDKPTETTEPEVVLPEPAIATAQLSTPPNIEATEAPRRETDTHPQPQEKLSAMAETAAPSLATAAAASTVAAASAGDVERYARGVALALGKARPKGIGRSGRVEVEFTLAETSGLIDAPRIARSSGSTRLDEIARTAVERATFPAPPRGLNSRQRTFRVPFTFD